MKQIIKQMKVEIVEVGPVDLRCLEMERGRVHQLDSGPLYVSAFLKYNEVRSAVNVLLKVLAHPPHVALSIDETRALEGNVLRPYNPEECLVWRVQFIPLGHEEGSIDLDGQICHVVTSYW